MDKSIYLIFYFNFYFIFDLLRPSSIYVYRILNFIINKFEYLIDLHTAGFGRINSLYCRADLNDLETKRMVEKTFFFLFNF
jgi:hypothetical protein